MSEPIIPREQVAEQLAVTTRVLTRYESHGLVHAVRTGSVEGYEPAEVRTLWTIVTLQRDLGINLAGVEAILHLRGQMAQLHHRLERLAAEIEEIVADPFEGDRDE